MIDESLVDPVEDELVGCQQTQAGVVLDRLQGADPGVELLGGQLAFQMVQALLPERVFHRTASSLRVKRVPAGRQSG